jgi:hypothetical protein
MESVVIGLRMIQAKFGLNWTSGFELLPILTDYAN